MPAVTGRLTSAHQCPRHVDALAAGPHDQCRFQTTAGLCELKFRVECAGDQSSVVGALDLRRHLPPGVLKTKDRRRVAADRLPRGSQSQPRYGLRKPPFQPILQPELTCRERPAASVRHATGQPPIAVVTAGNGDPAIIIGDREIDRLGTSRHAETTPDLGRVLPVHFHGVVGRGGSLPQSLGRPSVTGRARIDQHAVRSQRPLKRQRVGVACPGW